MATEVEIDQRVDAITDWVLDGLPYSEIVAKSVGEFGVSKRQAERYISEANAIVREIRLRQKEARISREANKLERIYEKAYSREDCAAATGAVRETIKLLGLAEPAKTEVKHDATDSLLGIFASVVTTDDKPA